MQYQNVEITLELRGIDELYQVYEPSLGKHVSPTYYRELHPNEDVSISRFLRFNGSGPSTIDLDGYLECNFVFLDEPERRAIAGKNSDFLVERVYRIEKGGIAAQNTIDLQVANPIKEIIWITRRSDATRFNEHANFTAKHPENQDYPLLASAKMIWNGLDRIEEKPAAYYSMIQPFQHHTSSPREGIYAMSFSIYPEKLQPSGSFNASMIQRIQLYVTTVPYSDIREIEVVVYCLYYNIFRVMGGSGGMVFQS